MRGEIAGHAGAGWDRPRNVLMQKGTWGISWRIASEAGSRITAMRNRERFASRVQSTQIAQEFGVLKADQTFWVEVFDNWVRGP
jgi:hypothetical protein